LPRKLVFANFTMLSMAAVMAIASWWNYF